MRRKRLSTDEVDRGKDIRFAVLAALCIAAFALAAIGYQNLSHNLRTSNEARDALAAQVEAMGGDPVAGPPGSRDEPEVGPSGPPGRPGRDAPAVTPSPGSRGPSGPPGEPGDDSTAPGPLGPSGPAGTDSTVPGPAGPAGPPGADSTVPGPRGEDGTDGRDGQTCPDGYSLQPPRNDPDALICRRDGAPPPDEPGPLALALDPTRREVA